MPYVSTDFRNSSAEKHDSGRLHFHQTGTVHALRISISYLVRYRKPIVAIFLFVALLLSVLVLHEPLFRIGILPIDPCIADRLIIYQIFGEKRMYLRAGCEKTFDSIFFPV